MQAVNEIFLIKLNAQVNKYFINITINKTFYKKKLECRLA